MVTCRLPALRRVAGGRCQVLVCVLDHHDGGIDLVEPGLLWQRFGHHLAELARRREMARATVGGAGIIEHHLPAQVDGQFGQWLGIDARPQDPGLDALEARRGVNLHDQGAVLALEHVHPGHAQAEHLGRPIDRVVHLLGDVDGELRSAEELIAPDPNPGSPSANDLTNFTGCFDSQPCATANVELYDGVWADAYCTF